MIYAFIDVRYLCHRANHALRGLQHGDLQTAVAFGFLGELNEMREMLNPDRWVFACDSHIRPKRRKLFPGYKSSRKGTDKTEEELEEMRVFNRQVEHLTDEILPSLGYRNIFCFEGYEADDIIAQGVDQLHSVSDEGYICSCDADFYQCLRANVSQYFPQRPTKPRCIYTAKQFREEYGIEPAAWAQVKAIAGCSSDDIPGVERVGETTAAKWVKGTLPEHHQTYKRISAGMDIFARNMPLVRLPFEGTPELDLVDDEWTMDKQRDVEDSLGIRKRRAKPSKKYRGAGFDL